MMWEDDFILQAALLVAISQSQTLKCICNQSGSLLTDITESAFCEEPASMSGVLLKDIVSHHVS